MNRFKYCYMLRHLLLRHIPSRILFLLIAASMTLSVCNTSYAAVKYFSDAPSGHWAYSYITRLSEMGVTSGVGNGRFGVGQPISRDQYALLLSKILQQQPGDIKPDISNGTALSMEQPITLSEAATLTIGLMGYDELAKQVGYNTLFGDICLRGVAEGSIPPSGNAHIPREVAAAVLINTYDAINKQPEYKNAFYAISSASQMDAISNFNGISFGWGKLELNPGKTKLSLNTTTSNNNEYYLPPGYTKPYEMATDKDKLLMIAVDAKNADYILANEHLRQSAVNLFADAVNASSGVIYDGVIVDFETLKGEAAADNLNLFLTALRTKLDKNSKLMYVAVHPPGRIGSEWFDGYDYKTIAAISDKIILMAHDYNAKQLTDTEMAQGITTTPLAPISEIYYALSTITKTIDSSHIDKILLQLNFDTVQWKLRDGKVINKTPYTPNYETLEKRISAADGVEIKYSQRYRSPYAVFYNSQDDTDNIVWYEDERSVNAKIRLAAAFGVYGISVWRLGNVPSYSHDVYLDVLDNL